MIKAVDEARLAEMRALNEALQELEASSGKLTLGQRLRGVVNRRDVAMVP